ncbi:MAG: PQQ-binding-like beta-propeller repeat protein [Fuerstiella sp.]|nr:PQQ-binding-like beta-propeller repeat protein [Fuerstiella sp.]MCP4855686.1 PQQ-binding-like beta-propeller repeat protein [Fuerstiella sp.]
MRCLNVAIWMLAAVLPAASATAQPQEPAADVDQNPERRKILQLIVQTNDAIAREQFLQAAELFDGAWELAMRHEDPLLTINTDVEDQLAPGEHRVRAGARSRLEQLFETAPNAFQRTYRQQVAQAADAAIAEAFQTAYVNEAVAAILRYQFTPTAQRALQTVVQLRISRGEYLQAALHFGKLLRLRNDTSAEQTAVLAILWWKAGLPEEARDYLADVVRRQPAQQVTIDGQVLKLPDSVAGIPTWFEAHFHGAAKGSGWHQPLGNYRRTLPQDVGPPALQPRWSHSTFQCVYDEDLAAMLEPLAGQLEGFSTGLLNSANSVMPVAMPLLVGDLLIYRGVANIRAVHRATGELVWETSKLDPQLSKALAAQRRTATDDTSRVQRMLRQPLFQHWFRANVGGQLTTDGSSVFAVEEATAETMFVDLDSYPLSAASPVNYLRVYDLFGRLRGRAGGSIGQSNGDGTVNPLAGMYFLGAPLVMGDRIYVMSESDQGIFLLQLKATEPRGAGGEFELRTVRSQLLATPRHALRFHPVRKYAGLIPSYSRGLLLCNTCDEQVIAVSAEDHSVRWVYRYPSNVAEHELGPGRAVVGNAFSAQQSSTYDLLDNWRDALPRIANGRVLLTPRDSDRLICLDLLSGRELWTQPRGGLRHIATARAGAVVLIGRNFVESLDIESGKRNWKTQIEDGMVCGTATGNDQLLQVPTSAPAIVTLDSETGRTMLVQPLENGIPLGNLLTVDGMLYSQSVARISSFGSSQDAQPNASILAAGHLLKRDVTAAVRVLEEAVHPDSLLNAVELNLSRQLLIDTQLESLRLDYAATSDQIPKLRQLITEMAPPDDQVTRLIQMMVGMTLGDVASLPAQWDHANRAQHLLDRLNDLEARGQLQDPKVPPDVLAERIVVMLDDSATSRDRYVTSGSLTQRGHRVPAAAIRSAMALRTAEVQRDVRRIVEPQIVERIESSSSQQETFWWLDMCLLTDFTDVARRIAMSGQAELSPLVDTAIRDLLLMSNLHSRTAPADEQNAVDVLISDWAESERWLNIRDLLQRSGVGAIEDVRANSDGDAIPSTTDLPIVAAVFSDFRLPQSSVISGAVRKLWQKAVQLSPPAPWQGIPRVAESEAHAGGPAQNSADSVHNNIPLFGPAGGFLKWNFLKPQTTSGVMSAQLMHAYDADGRLRWTFDTGDPKIVTNRWPTRSYNKLSANYLCAYGHLLAVKLGPMLSMLDCSHATIDVPPKVLWQRNIAATVGNALSSQSFVQAWQRTTQYDMQPSGLFPAGPITRHGIPVYSGRQMVMLNTMTGDHEWKVDGLPTDCTIAGDDDSLLLLSESAGSVEVRDTVDGSLRASHPLPDWWTQANENSNASVQSFQLEPGEQQRFRIAVRGRFCLLSRMNTVNAALESFDLAENRIAWTIKLPADSVVSNLVDGHVAVLSDGDQLKIYNLSTQQLVADVSVPVAKKSQYLYLRPGRENWLILTACLDQEFSEQNPISESVQVNGQLYAVNRDAGTVAWTTKIDHEWMRALHPSRNPMPTVSPLLILLKRPSEQLVPRAYNGRIFDVKSGKLLYQDQDLGRSLSWHSTTLRLPQDTIDVAFEKRTITFDYSPKTNN